MIPTPPINNALVDKEGRVSRPASEWMNLMWLAANSVTESGTTANRPTTNLWIGRFFYDTTLNLPIWVNAVTPSIVWKDGAGNTV